MCNSDRFSGAFSGPRSTLKVRNFKAKVAITARSPEACGGGEVMAFVPMTDWKTHINENSCSSAIARDCHMGTWDECY